MKKILGALLFFSLLFDAGADELAQDLVITSAHYANGDVVPYLLTQSPDSKPRYVLILMPGGAGNMNIKLVDDKPSFGFKGNFLIRVRKMFADPQTAVISTDSSGSQERMGAVVEDAQSRFPGAAIYILGTSRSTLSTTQLAERMDGKVAGFVHTSSFADIAFMDTRKLKSRHLIVHHVNDNCRHTLYGNAQRSHEKFGTELITMEGGISHGDPCEAFAHHGFNGIEKETVIKIKTWIKRP
jgi:hypothetical protein